MKFRKTRKQRENKQTSEVVSPSQVQMFNFLSVTVPEKYWGKKYFCIFSISVFSGGNNWWRMGASSPACEVQGEQKTQCNDGDLEWENYSPCVNHNIGHDQKTQ